MEKRIHISNELTGTILRAAQLKVRNGEIITPQGIILDELDYRYINTGPVIYKDMTLEGVIIYGNGEVEIGCSNDRQAYPWDRFPNETLEEIIKKIITL